MNDSTSHAHRQSAISKPSHDAIGFTIPHPRPIHPMIAFRLHEVLFVNLSYHTSQYLTWALRTFPASLVQSQTIS
ncbi:hypothetical protein CY34DRAFT_813635, partial [Suillus luteus UH-Slu-Lm8-n1]